MSRGSGTLGRIDVVVILSGVIHKLIQCTSNSFDVTAEQWKQCIWVTPGLGMGRCEGKEDVGRRDRRRRVTNKHDRPDDSRSKEAAEDGEWKCELMSFDAVLVLCTMGLWPMGEHHRPYEVASCKVRQETGSTGLTGSTDSCG